MQETDCSQKNMRYDGNEAVNILEVKYISQRASSFETHQSIR